VKLLTDRQTNSQTNGGKKHSLLCEGNHLRTVARNPVRHRVDVGNEVKSILRVVAFITEREQNHRLHIR